MQYALDMYILYRVGTGTIYSKAQILKATMLLY